MRKILTPFCALHSLDCQGMPFVLLNTIFCRHHKPRNDALTALPRKPALLLALVVLTGLAAHPAWAQSAVSEGEKLAFDRGKGNCLTCHVIKGGDLPGSIAPELVDIKSKYPNRADLIAIVTDETLRNLLTVMPPFGRNRILTEREINAGVDFLLT